MKTNQILSRKMGNFEVTQRTQDGMFNATALLKQWNSSAGQKKMIGHYFENKPTQEFITALLDEENKHRNTDKSTLSAIYEKKRGISGSTWMSPLLFIDFAMWLNPTFKVQVLKFVYDELIKFRNEAGDAYLEMSSEVAKISPKKEIPMCIAKVAQAINYIAFGRHEKEIRNRQDESAMKELVSLEREISLLIRVGHIKSFGSLMDYLRDKYRNKYQPAVFN